MNTEKIEHELENGEVVLKPEDYERTDQELKDQPEHIHLMELCYELNIQI